MYSVHQHAAISKSMKVYVMADKLNIKITFALD